MLTGRIVRDIFVMPERPLAVGCCQVESTAAGINGRPWDTVVARPVFHHL